MSRGRPARLPIESPDWIPYAAALRDAVERFRSVPLANMKLNSAFAAGAIRCKIERLGKPPGLLAASAGVFVTIAPTDAELEALNEVPDIDIVELSAGWENRLTIRVDASPCGGWLFIWEPDLLKYFGVTAEALKVVTNGARETRIPTGRPRVHDWIKLTLIAARLHRNFRKLTRNAIVGKLQDCLEDEGIKSPADSELQKMVAQVFAFDEWCPPKRGSFQKGR